MEVEKEEVPCEKPEVPPPAEDEEPPRRSDRREKRKHHHRRGVVKLYSDTEYEPTLESCLEVLNSRREVIIRGDGVDTLTMFRDLIREINEKFPNHPEQCDVKISAKIGYKSRRRQHQR